MRKWCKYLIDTLVLVGLVLSLLISAGSYQSIG